MSRPKFAKLRLGSCWGGGGANASAGNGSAENPECNLPLVMCSASLVYFCRGCCRIAGR